MKVASPEIKLHYIGIDNKDIHDNAFKKALRRAGIPESILELLFNEYEAGPETYGVSS